MTESDITLIVVDELYGFIEGGKLPVKGGKLAVAKTVEFIVKYGDRIKRIFLPADCHPMYHGSFKESETYGIRIEGKPEESNQFPRHCVAYTHDAAIVEELMEAVREWNEKYQESGKGMRNPMYRIIPKGKELNREDYSAFKFVDVLYDNDNKTPDEFVFATPDGFNLSNLDSVRGKRGFYQETVNREKFIRIPIDSNVVVCGIAGDICVLNTLKSIKVTKPSVFVEGCASLDDGTTLRNYMKEHGLNEVTL